MKTVQIHYDESMQEHLMWFLNSLPNIIVEEKKSPAKPKVRKTNKLAGCLSKYAKNVDLPFREIREMAWDAELRDKYDTRRH
ncbi:MAG TPA: hypothetical protein PLV58_07495 [Campylobacterales bacterium]|nr:hypothetical protein [Campylobacterales bacterium]